MILENKKEKYLNIKETIGTIIATLIMAIGTSLFLLPNQLSSGGFAGIGTILYYFLKIPMGITMLILNIPFFLISKLRLGKEFFVKSLIGTISFSIFVDILDKIPPLTNDRFLACIYGGIIIGIGTAIILKNNSSTGGSDLISYLIKSYNPKLRVGTILVIIDTIIVLLNMIFFKEIEIGLYSTITIYIMGKIIDIIFEGIYWTKLLIIISDKNEEIAKKIGEEIKRGTTGIYGKGMYKENNKLILMCAATRIDIIKIKEIIKKIDEKAFVIIVNSREVVGKGFKNV